VAVQMDQVWITSTLPMLSILSPATPVRVKLQLLP
jgi:hypothetical protein